MEPTVSQMSVSELRELISEVVEETFAKYADPDYGLELREEVVEGLLRQSEAVRQGERGIPAEQVYKELGLE